MKLYAVRDRLIDYFMQPFVGPDDKNVQAALARTVNNQEGPISDIAQAPHHFELWEIAEIQDDGHIRPTRVLICDCASLVRRGIRTREQPESRAPEETTGQSPQEPRRARIGAHANPGPVPDTNQGQDGAPAEVRRGPQGGYPPRNSLDG